MKNRNHLLSLNFSFVNGKFLIVVMVIIFYFTIFAAGIQNIKIFSSIGVDYLAFWSAGKIADQEGYAHIYDLGYLQRFQDLSLTNQGGPNLSANKSTPVFPAPYLAFFILPFQLLSVLPVTSSYWVWTSLNLFILLIYLAYFLKQTNPLGKKLSESVLLVILIFLSWASIFNFICGQVEVLLVVCVGEFLRNASKGKPTLAGIWLGGLLIKPQLLILMIPILLIWQNWRVLKGFITSSAMILFISLMLSGFNGFIDLIGLLTKFSAGMETTGPEFMINWRMVGLILNSFLDTTTGWIFTLIGIFFTLLAVYQLIKHRQVLGSSQWVITMLGVFSATLAVTWHSHYHMAMVLIPLLLYAAVNGLMPEKYLIWWVIVTPITLLIALTIDLFVPFMKIIFFDNYLSVFAFTGIIVNLVILLFTLNFPGHTSIKNV